MSEWIQTYAEAVRILAAIFVEMGQGTTQADHNARAALARLSESGITVTPEGT